MMVNGYTHFIGVLPPKEIALILEESRRYMRKTFGCRSGHGTPLHITVIPPFNAGDSCSTKDLIQVLQNISFEAFTGKIENYSCFGDRTIYARIVEDKKWERLRNTVYQSVSEAIPGVLKKDQRFYHPHITIANRDIPQGCTSKALNKLGKIPLLEAFPVDNLVLFEFTGGRWINVFERYFS